MEEQLKSNKTLMQQSLTLMQPPEEAAGQDGHRPLHAQGQERDPQPCRRRPLPKRREPQPHGSVGERPPRSRGPTRERVQATRRRQFRHPAAAAAADGVLFLLLVLQRAQGVWPAKAQGEMVDLESPTSTLTFAENRLPALMAPGAVPVKDDNAANHQGGDRWGPQGSEWKCLAKERMEGLAGASFSAEVFSGEAPWLASEPYPCWGQFGAGFTGMLLGGSEDHSSYANEQEKCVEEGDDDEEEEEEEDEAEEEEAEGEGKENSNYWNSILNDVNSSCSASLPENF